MSTQGRVLVLLKPDLAIDFDPFGQIKPIFGRDAIQRMKEANGIRVVKSSGKSHRTLVIEVLKEIVDKATVNAGLSNDNPNRYVYVKSMSDRLRRVIRCARKSARNSKRREELST